MSTCSYFPPPSGWQVFYSLASEYSPRIGKIMGNPTARRYSTPGDTIVFLMGPAGSGKSTFMQIATRQNAVTPGHGRQSSKPAIRAMEVFHPTTKEPLILVDTPALDDTRLDLQMVKTMTTWLRRNRNDCRVAGIIYMYRISDNRCVGSPYGNALLFDTLCRNDSTKKIVIATTMWKRTSENVAIGREEGLGKKRWREMLLNGSRIMRFHDSFTSAWDIIDNVLKSRTSSAAPPIPQIDIDLVRPQMNLDKIQAGIDQLQKVKSANRHRSITRLDCFASTEILLENNWQAHIAEASNGVTSDTDPRLLSRVGNRPKRPNNCDRGVEPFTGTRPLVGRDQAVAVLTRIEDLSKDQIIIALMGRTGAGKSSFIGAATGYSDGVGHQLQSFTHDVRLIKFQCHQRNNINLVFVDTPALDHTHKSYADVFHVIAQWLKKLQERKINLAGVLYFHRISDLPSRDMWSDLAIFEVLCRQQSLKNVIFVTTMWDQVDKDRGLRIEEELKERYLRGMINRGAKVMRYNGTSDTTWDIIGKLYTGC